jgi:N-acetylated-alpha-linked acidic dipeptidase
MPISREHRGLVIERGFGKDGSTPLDPIKGKPLKSFFGSLPPENDAMLRRAALAALACLTAASAVAQPAPKTDPKADPKAAEAKLEKDFDAAIHPNDLRDWMARMASQPNHVGSPHDKENAEFELAKFKSWGWDARIETFRVLYPTPIAESLSMAGPHAFAATLTEPPVAGDPATQQTAAELPAYVAYQGDGDVTAPLVYVNYGMPEDYRTLARLGVDVAGKIVIARYGEGWRGLKPKLAQEHGAVGCIIYSDPSGDGYAVGRTYPDGPMRPAHGVQRGSVADMTMFPGDPLTAGLAPGAAPRTRADAPTIMKIPVLPISYADAQVFLGALNGPMAPAAWRGTLPITYHAGPGEAAVHMVVKSDWSEKTIYDVIAVMRGAALPDEWVLRGNHHDGWVFGASDPLSGQVALMAEAQAFGALVKQGWRPKRTLVYASWDAEEPMLVGSTAWAEAHAAELKQKAVLYVNSDTNARGILNAGGSQDFQHVVNQVANAVIDPETHVPVGERKRAQTRVAALEPDATAAERAAAKDVEQGHEFPLQPLGSGSDYSTFLQHLGLPAIDLGYDGEGQHRGVYHSAYDTFAHHSRFVDPGFVYDALLARTAGRLMMRVADADLPVQHETDFARAVADDLAGIKKLADSEREEADTREKLLHDRAYQLAADPVTQENPPEKLDVVPFIDFAPLENAVAALQRSARAYDSALAAHGAAMQAEKLARLQTMMQSINQTLAPDIGLPGRPWYRNLIYAPGHLTGYGAKTLPGVREAIEDRRWHDADRYAVLTANAVQAFSDRLTQAGALLNEY